MRQKLYLAISVTAIAASAFLINSVAQVTAQESGAPGAAGGAGGTGGPGGYGGSGGSGGAGGEGGAGGYGGSGGSGGGGGVSIESGHIASNDDYVYVLRRGTLYQYAAYDLKLVKKKSLADRFTPGQPEDVTATDDFVYALLGNTMHKLAARDLEGIKSRKLD